MFFALFQFTIPAPSLQSLSSVNQGVILIAVNVFLIVALLVALLFILRAIARTRTFLPEDFRQQLLLVKVPKDTNSTSEEDSIENIRSEIGLAESFLTSLGGLKAQRGFKAWLWGRTDNLSLEIVAQNNQISFYISTPKYLKEFVVQQLLAQYPEASLSEAQDYNIFKPDGNVLAGYFKLARSYIFPIKTYIELNSDPLNSITNSLSSIGEGDGAAIQIVIRSAHKSWHSRGTKVASEMQQGKTLNQAMASTSSSPINTLSIFSNKPQSDSEPKTLSPMEQETVKGIEEKTAKAGLQCNIRVVTSATDQITAQNYLTRIVDSFSQFNFYQYGNSFKFVKENPKKIFENFIYRRFKEGESAILNSEELSSIFHLPTPFLETPNINWLLAKKLPPANNIPKEGLLLGENIYRGTKRNIYLQTEDRRRHAYVIGMTGTGKSVLMSNMAIQDIKSGNGVCVIDPHGSLVESIMPNIPKERMKDVVYFNPADTDRPIGLNMLEANTPEEQDFAVQEMISIFYKLVSDPSMVGPMFEHNMRNAMLTLMADRDDPGTIAEIPRIFSDASFQKYKVAKVTDPMVRSFWEQEMAKTSDFHKSEMLGYLISKVGRFIENAMVRNIIGQAKSGFNFRDIMDNKKILLVNLSKGKVGEVNSNLLGLIMVAKLQMAALSRTDIPEESRNDFYLYIDEFQNFITDSIATILAEARKYKLNLILAHQYINQLTEGSGPESKSHGSKIRDAVFGNVGTLVSFRVGVDDAEFISKQMAPVVSSYDLINIEKYNAYVRLLVDNQPLRAFNIRTLSPESGTPSVMEEVVELSRWTYGKERSKVEQQILKQTKLGSVSSTTNVERSA